MKIQVRHETRYAYSHPAHYGLLQLRLRPKPHMGQTIENWSLSLDGAETCFGFEDQFYNHVDLIELSAEAQSVTIKVEGEVETRNCDGILGSEKGAMPLWVYRRQTALTELNAEMIALSEAHAAADIAALHNLSAAILERTPYAIGKTSVETTAAEALALGEGVCQDHTHLFIACARHLGVPARYVSGYLLMDDRTHQQASHAWAEAYVENLGWVGFDISNVISPDERYIKVAHGLDYRDCAPTRGVTVGGKQEQLEVSIQVQQ